MSVLTIINSDTAKITAPYSALQAVQDGWQPIQIPDPLSGAITEKSQATNLLFHVVDPANPVLLGEASILGEYTQPLVDMVNLLIGPINAKLVELESRIAALETP